MVIGVPEQSWAEYRARVAALQLPLTMVDPVTSAVQMPLVATEAGLETVALPAHVALEIQLCAWWVKTAGAGVNGDAWSVLKPNAV